MKQIFFLFSISTFGISSLCQTPTVNNLSKFITTTGTLGNSVIYNDGSFVGIGTTTPDAQLNLTGNQHFTSANSSIYALPSSGFCYIHKDQQTSAGGADSYGG